jgi:Mycobacterium membrane protein
VARTAPWLVLKQQWVSTVVAVALLIGGCAIARLHSFFGFTSQTQVEAGAADQIQSINPKYVAYEIFGPVRTRGMVSYLDEFAQPHEAIFDSLPWSFSLTTTLPSVLAHIMAQGDGSPLGCRIRVNDVVRDVQVSDDRDAMAFCLVKAA